MLSKNEAFKIAEEAICEMQKKTKYNDFSPIELNGENDSFWTYVSGSQEMINETVKFFRTQNSRYSLYF